ncbi:MAG TPA: hypothetical protein VKK79_12960 [Candidatus Lokiarchaeia archaeon]|nr:hypothetical protein [Candidatus Lokiarchaeia archaeon]
MEVIETLRNSPGPVQTWELKKRLSYSSGKLESALRRLESRRLIVRKKVTRVTENQEPRLVALVWDREFEADDELPFIEREVPVEVFVDNPLGLDLVQWFEVLEPVENPANAEEVIIPVKLTKFEASLLSAIPEVNPKFASLVDFLQKAVKNLLGKQSDKVKMAAVNYLVNQGTITQEYGEWLLHGDRAGGNEDEDDTGGSEDTGGDDDE